ncbi:rho GTPase-activating protein 11A isoform X3 [Colossoma macropomum]|uniref:rho GTPase-activating protein 11A isoform X3 n=1 Tax=Colossoma macropomum TaxID=42526 RepID=UPI001863F85B|nr:rho GTPase-activating protein 11A isoform X3 [Colossoma macropomum]
MKTVERNVVRLAVVQHLRATYGIKTKNWNKCKTSSSKLTADNSVKVFGVALESLPHCHVLDYGDIPCFLVDACTCLMLHLDTEGLFRKSGSIVRVKALRAKLDQAEECLSTALPLDIAGLLKQFFRELPEPILPADLHNAFLKAQELATVEERTSATILLSCILPHGNLNTLRYFFSFLKRVSQRCAENKMDSSNLSVIFAPNLLHCGEGTEKMNASTEKKLKLQAAVVQCLIDNAEDLGVVPEFLMARVPAMLGCEAGLFSPSDAVEDGNTPSGAKRCRRSLGDVVNGALNKLKSNRTPSHTPQPNGTVHSASGTLDSSQSALSSVGRCSRVSASSARRKSKRLSRRNVNRAESGKAGCFSPRVAKKEAMRKSLRLRFSLGKTNRDCSVLSHSLPVPKGSEVIGWRLATQESVTSFHFTKDTTFSPSVLRNGASTGSKYISKSENNLLTPCGTKEPATSWSAETPDGTQAYTGSSFSDTPMSACLKTTYCSEPIIVSKPPLVGNIPKSLCCATSAESLASSESFSEEPSQAGPTLVRVRGALDEPVSTLCTTVSTLCTTDMDYKEEPKEKTEENANNPSSSELSIPSENSPVSSELKKNSSLQVSQSLVEDQNVTFGQIELVPLSPLHIDSVLFDTETGESSMMVKSTQESSVSVESTCLIVDSSTGSANCSRLIDALDIQSPVAFRLNSSITVQSTPFAARERARELNTSQPDEFKEPLPVEASSESSSQHESQQREPSLDLVQPHRTKVSDHIQRFNMLTLSSPKPKVVRSPLKFQRTPVRQSVRRINSLLNQTKEVRSGWCAASRGSSGMKALSLESGLSADVLLQGQATEVPSETPVERVIPKPPEPPIKSATCCTIMHCPLGDITNTEAPKAKGDAFSAKGIPSEFPKSVLLEAAERDMSHYRGSPKNPLTQVKLLSAMKPIDL